MAVSPQDDVIYYATQAGEVVQADATTLDTIWKFDINAPVLADITLNDDGTLLYIADSIGNVLAYKVAESDAIAQATIALTTTMPTTGQPSPADPSTTVAPDTPVPDGTASPTDAQTEAPAIPTDFPLVRTTAPGDDPKTGDPPPGEGSSGSAVHPDRLGLLSYVLVPATYFMVFFL